MLEDGLRVVTCDIRPLAGAPADIPHSYVELSLRERKSFRTIVFFAGVSSVPRAESNPQGAVRENVTELVEFAASLNPSQRLIYASSASVYSQAFGSRQGVPSLSIEGQPLPEPKNSYDASKAACDFLMQATVQASTVGLRMGTVSGFSPALRPELVFNAMCLSALKEGRISLRNPWAYRGILFLSDLWETVLHLVGCVTVPKTLNVASVNVSMSHLADIISSEVAADIEALPDAPTYSFRLDTTQWREMVRHPGIDADEVIHDQVRSFASYFA